MQPKESKTTRHFTYSITKSIFRLAAAASLYIGEIEASACFFAVGEILGILEEL
jgi:hypothetical protein